MKQITLYECELCKFTSQDRLEVLRHEADHYHLTPEQYQHWRHLCHNAARAGYAADRKKNPQTDKAFDEACQTLADFEEKFNLSAAQKPSGLY